jgi:hypothetical protein
MCLPIERGNEHSGSIKCCETTQWLHDLWPLEWYSAPQLVSQSVGYESPQQLVSHYISQ